MNNPLQMLMQLLQMGNNPNAIIQSVVNKNPQMNFLLNQMKTSGLTPQQYVTQIARQQNIDIQPLINVLNQHGIRS